MVTACELVPEVDELVVSKVVVDWGIVLDVVCVVVDGVVVEDVVVDTGG